MRGTELVARFFNVILPVAATALILVYRDCGTSCSYLRGTLCGIDLSVVGILFMTVLMVIHLPGGNRIGAPVHHVRTALLSGGLGGEIILIRFQLLHDVYCAYCLAFCVIVLLLFVLNARTMNRALAAGSATVGALCFYFFFDGSVLPLF
ncbi:MAG TPA: hypothetical protein ENN35_01845 [Deltaproteobacteria bacterium]|nr:hypothetical protein [Deltaproteobacteria bacterium]